MTNRKSTAPAAKSKAPAKLTPRPAEAVAKEPVVEASAPAPQPTPVPATQKAVAKARPAKPEAAVAKAPEVAAPAPVAKPEKAAKPAKPRKQKLVRDSYAMPDSEYARIGELKKRLAGLSLDYKKSEILRAGIALMAALNDAELTAVMGRVERIKTGRPSKK